jgi:hypothetical protein
MKRVLTVLFVLSSLAGLAAADTLVTTDGKRYEGRLIRRTRNEVVFEVHKYGAKMTRTFRADRVRSVKESQEAKVARKPQETRPAKPAEAEAGPLPPEPPAPPIVKHDGPTYYLIPLRKVVGRELVAHVLVKALADAEKRKPDVVVLHVDSPGGLIAEVEPLIKAVRDHSKKLRIVVLVKRALSAAAVTALAAKEIYFEPEGIFGAATAFRMTPEGAGMAVEEKMQSVWRAVARSAAETGGHDALLAEAMIDRQLSLYVAESDGRKVIKQGTGPNMVTRRGRLLTLTDKEARACGLSAGTAKDVGDLGKLLGYPSWKECRGHGTLLADHWEKTVEAIDEQLEALWEKYQHNIQRATDNYPWRYQYSKWATGPRQGKFTPDSQARWRKRSGICAAFLAKAEKNMEAAAALIENMPGMEEHAERIRDGKKRIEEDRKKLYRNMNVTNPADIER